MPVLLASHQVTGAIQLGCPRYLYNINILSNLHTQYSVDSVGRVVQFSCICGSHLGLRHEVRGGVELTGQGLDHVDIQSRHRALSRLQQIHSST